MENVKTPGYTACNRLFDAQTHWVRALESYFSPDDFRIEINACIQALRNVTFALQADKSLIPNFEQWYEGSEGWQSKMRADEIMKWSVNARNKIVKAKDLELHSKLRASLVGSYLDSEIPIFQSDYSPQISSNIILAEFRKKGISADYMKHAQLRIERRWVIKDFPKTEFLKLLSHCWIFLSRILQDLPNASPHLSLERDWDLPPCMLDNDEFRSCWIKVSTGQVSILNSRTVDLSSEHSRKQKVESAKRYGLDTLLSFKNTGNELYDRAKYFFEIAKKMLKTDKHHVFIVFLFTRNKEVAILELQPEERSDKYRMWHKIASEVKLKKAYSIICISEAWTATIPIDQPFQHAAEVPNRGEALKLIAASEDGAGIRFVALFTRSGKEIIIHETQEEYSLDSVNVIAPVLAAWKEMAETRKIGD